MFWKIPYILLKKRQRFTTCLEHSISVPFQYPIKRGQSTTSTNRVGGIGCGGIFCPTHLFCPTWGVMGEPNSKLTRSNLVASMATAEFRRLESVREKARCLRGHGFSYALIATGLKIPKSTAQTFCKVDNLRESPGRPSFLTAQDESQLREYITDRAQHHRPVTYSELRAKVRICEQICRGSGIAGISNRVSCE
jgi:hypothetical protein